jgi:hypothetical protein
MSLENKILENRLIYKDSVIGVSSISRCAKHLLALKNSSTLETSKTSLETFLKELLLFKIELEKTKKLLRNIDVQQTEYENIEIEISQAISLTKEEITFLLQKLQEEKEIRHHRVECETIAIEVNTHMKRSLLKRKISDLEENIASTNQSLDDIEREILIRNEQYQQFLTALAVLERKVFEDEDSSAMVESDGGEEEAVEREGEEERTNEREREDREEKEEKEEKRDEEEPEEEAKKEEEEGQNVDQENIMEEDIANEQQTLEESTA